MTAEPGDRLFAALPAVFRAADATGDLARLLAAFETLLFDGEGDRDDQGGAPLPGLERTLLALPALFAPQGGLRHGCADRFTPEPFLPWLASWLGFTPHALFAPQALRRIAAGIVPLHGLRGTREHLEKLLALCFEGEHVAFAVDDRPRSGFTVGFSRVGEDTRLAATRPFWFRVHVEPGDAAAARWRGPDGPDLRDEMERRLRAVIDFAKPAHTTYELQWGRRPRAVEAPAAGIDAPSEHP